MKNIHKTAALGLLTASAAFAQGSGTVGDGPFGLSKTTWIVIIAVVVIVVAIIVVKNKKP